MIGQLIRDKILPNLLLNGGISKTYPDSLHMNVWFVVFVICSIIVSLGFASLFLRRPWIVGMITLLATEGRAWGG